MDSVELSAKWTLFMEAEGDVLEQEIYKDLSASSNLFDMEDGVHAKWSNGSLGLLLVFDETEANGLFDAFRAAIGGVQEANEAFAYWAASLMGLLRQALAERWTDESDC